MATFEIHTKMFNPVYLPYLNDETRNQIFFGGSSSGKSKFIAQRCVLDLMKGDRNYLITRKVASTIAASCFNEVQKVINEWGVDKWFTVIKSPPTITCNKNGMQAVFVGLDDVEKVKSITPVKGVFTDIWEEEATENEPADDNQLDKRLRGYSKVKKRRIKSFNPILLSHWLHEKYFKKWVDDSKVLRDGNLLIVHTTYKDNKFLMSDDIAALENVTDKYWYDVYSLGKWGSLGGVIFKNWKVEDCSEVRKKFDRFSNGLDFGFASDPAAGVRTHWDRKRGIVYILDELYERGLTNDDLAKLLKPMFGGEAIYCDSADPKSIQELAERGICAVGAEKGKDSVRHGIQWLQQMDIVIDVGCPSAQKEFSAYKWEESKDGITLPKPVDRNNHLIDAIRYALSTEMHYIREASPKEPTKPRDYDNYKELNTDDYKGSWMTG